MKISIITITLNSEKTIRDTLNSVLSQSYKNIEHILVDGGSTDQTLAILKRYPNNNKKIFIKKKSRIYSAMNHGIRRSTGDVVAILNSDDVYHSNTIIKETVDIIKKNPKKQIFFGNVAYFEKNSFYKISRYYSANKFKTNQMKYGLMPPHPASFIKKKVYDMYGLYNENFDIASDFEIFLKFLVIKKVNFKIIHKDIVRMRTGGISGKNVLSYLKTTNEIISSFKLNKLKTNYFKIIMRIPAKLKQILLFNEKKINRNFGLFKIFFDFDNFVRKTFIIINNTKKIPFTKNFILSGMNLAFLGYYAIGKVYPSKNLYHWPDGIWAKRFINVKKIPGRKIINELTIPNKINKILVLGNITKKSKEFLYRKYKRKIKSLPLPYGNIETIKKVKIILPKNALVFITLPTPKQEQLAYHLSKKNRDFKIICIGASIAIASGEEKKVPTYLKNYEFFWRLRSDTFRRVKRLIETFYYYSRAKIFSNLYKETMFKIID
jgi:glycosyltransferase involved in cell wall biosynthesis